MRQRLQEPGIAKHYGVRVDYPERVALSDTSCKQDRLERSRREAPSFETGFGRLIFG